MLNRQVRADADTADTADADQLRLLRRLHAR